MLLTDIIEVFDTYHLFNKAIHVAPDCLPPIPPKGREVYKQLLVLYISYKMTYKHFTELLKTVHTSFQKLVVPSGREVAKGHEESFAP